MILSKKKISILLSVLVLMMVLIFTFCSFTAPTYSDTVVLNERPSLNDVLKLQQIMELQRNLGFFNTLKPVALCLYNNRLLYVFTYANGDYYSINISNNSFIVNSAGYNIMTTRLSTEGFGVLDPNSAFHSDLVDVIFYREPRTDSFIFNSQFLYGSGTLNEPLLDNVYNYLFQYYQAVNENYDSAVESGYNNGYTDGYLTGNADGYRNGYDEGIDYGYNVGYPAGYDSGLADGYQTGFADGLETGYRNGYYQGDIDGYESGYDEGYSEGYVDGYDTAERETVIEYVEPVEISVGSIISGISSVPDNILNGTFDFELFGINVYGLLKVIIILFVISAVVVFVIKRSA